MLPRTIWMLWLQGWAAAPEIVKNCVASWKYHNPDWDIQLLTADDIPKLLDGDPGLAAVQSKSLPPEAFSNLVRMGLLLRYGGVWVDATTFCLKPLDSWIDDAAKQGVFAFSNPGPDRMLSSWFIAAHPHETLLAIWQNYCCEYWRDRDERHIYFWFHGYLFSKAYERNEIFRRIWDAVPKISADGPHYFLPHEEKLLEPFDDADWGRLLASGVPLVKLNHKTSPDALMTGKFYQYIAAWIARLQWPSHTLAGETA